MAPEPEEPGAPRGEALPPVAVAFLVAVVLVAGGLFAYDRFNGASRASLDAPERAASGQAREAPSLFDALAGHGPSADALPLARSAVGGYRVGISEVHAARGDWPATLADAGLPAFDASLPGPVQAIELQPRGVLVATLRDPFAAGSRLVLTPTADAHHLIRWDCRVEGDPSVSSCEP